MAIAKLSIDLEARLASLQQGLDKAGLLAERQAARIDAAFKNVSVSLASLGAGLGFAGITAFVRTTLDGIDRLNDLRDATGASIENLSALEDLAVRTGTSFETMSDALVKVNRVLADAKPGSEQEKAIKALGLSVEELRRLDPVQALQQVAVAFGGFADGADKSRFAGELFGKAWSSIAPLMADLAQQTQLAATVTTEQAAAAEKLNLQLAAAQKNFTDLARSVISDLLPALNRGLEALNAFAKGPGIIAATAEVLKGNVFANAADGLQFYRDRLKEIDAQLTRLDKLSTDDRQSIAISSRREAESLRQRRGEVEKFVNAYKTLQALDAPQADFSNEGRGRARALPRLPSIGDSSGARAAGAAPARAFTSNSVDQGLVDALRSLEQTDVAKIRELEAQLGALFDLQRETRGDPAVVQAIARVRDELASIGPEARKAADDKRRLDSILSQTPTGQLAETLRDIELINRAFDSGAVTVEQWAEAVGVATQRIQGDLEKPIERINTFAEQAARNIQDALGSTLEDALGGSFDNIGDRWLDLLRRMAAQALAANLSDALLGNFGKTGKVGGLIGAGLDLFAGFFDQGGRIPAGKFGVVGERRPELVQGPATVTPMADLAGGGGSTFIYNVAAGVGRSELVAALRQVKEQTKAEMRAELRLQRVVA